MREITVDEFAEILKKRTQIKADAVLIIDGPPGNGKTTLEIEIARRIDPLFTIRRNIIFDPNPKNIMEKITKELPPGSPVGLDEGMRAANARKAMTANNLFLGEYFSVNRKDFKIIMICVPSIQQIDTSLRNQRATFWVHVIERGVALVFKRSRAPADGEPWGIGEKGIGIKNLLKKINTTERLIDLNTEEMINALSKHDNFAFVVRFPQMAPELEAEYEAAAAEMRKELKLPDMMESGTRIKLYRLQIQKMIEVFHNELAWNKSQIAGRFGMNPQSVTNILQKSGAWNIEKE